MDDSVEVNDLLAAKDMQLARAMGEVAIAMARSAKFQRECEALRKQLEALKPKE